MYSTPTVSLKILKNYTEKFIKIRSYFSYNFPKVAHVVCPQIYIVKARCVTTKKARKDGCLPAPAPVGRRKIVITNDRGTMII